MIMKPDHQLETRSWSFGTTTWELGESPKIMGILNVTPDSFSDGGNWLSPGKAIDHALELVEQGADILDVGGESTRPGATPVSVQDELDRVIPVIEQLADRISIPIAVDTMKAPVAKEALAAGADVINDVTAFTFDEQMVHVAAASDCGVILMHMLGTPQTMQDEPTYKDVVREVSVYLQERVSALTDRGVAANRIVVDPGVGFGKTAQHNLSLLSNVEKFRQFGHPVLIGHSRKRFLGKIIGRTVEERLAGTIGVSIALAQQHADILRVHDVAAVKDAIAAWRCLSDLN